MELDILLMLSTLADGVVERDHLDTRVLGITHDGVAVAWTST